ncbi:MAG: hypothetical protein WC637_08950, partial [Victivallales bacterium]
FIQIIFFYHVPLLFSLHNFEFPQYIQIAGTFNGDRIRVMFKTQEYFGIASARIILGKLDLRGKQNVQV